MPRLGDEPDVAVVFTRLEGRNYYENGSHCG